MFGLLFHADELLHRPQRRLSVNGKESARPGSSEKFKLFKPFKLFKLFDPIASFMRSPADLLKAPWG
jgi:hypothetical protein